MEVRIVLGVGGAFLVAAVIIILAVVLKKAPVIPAPPSRQFDGPPPQWIEGGQWRVGTPPEGTLKILPGRFLFEADGEQLRLFRWTDSDRVEITIGRDAGEPYRHLQLKPPSVGRKHAKLVYEDGFYSLVNYSSTNPTVINGEVLTEGASRRLIDEDRIEIGEVALVFHES